MIVLIQRSFIKSLTLSSGNREGKWGTGAEAATAAEIKRKMWLEHSSLWKPILLTK